MSLLRGIVFNIGYGISVAIFGTYIKIFGRFLTNRQRYNTATLWSKILGVWLKLSCGITVVVEGLEHLPKTASVVVSNHQSTWESFFLQKYFTSQSTVLKQELMSIPFFGEIVRCTNPIVINRDERTNALKQILRQGSERLQSNSYVLIFPEGTRVPVGENGKHYPGGSMLAINNGVPIVPLVHNAGTCWPNDSIRKYPGVITVKFGEAVSTEGRKAKELTKELGEWLDTHKNALASQNRA